MTACCQSWLLLALRSSGMLAVLLVGVFAARPAAAQLLQRSVAFEGARILTMDGAVIEEGTLVIKGDKIRAVGAHVKLPLLAKKIDARGTTITPGLIDVNSLLGRGTRATSGGSAARRAEDAFDRYDSANVIEVLRQGITSVFLSPEGPAGICGTGAVIRLTRGSGAVGSVLKSKAALCIDLSSASKPVARLKILQGVQKTLRGARQYRLSLEAYEEDLAKYTKHLESQAKKSKKKSPAKKVSDGKEKDGDTAAKGDSPEKKKPVAGTKPNAAKSSESAEPKKPRRPTRNVAYEVILQAIDAEIPVRMVAHRSSDILNALELADEFSFNLFLEGATEAHLVAQQIAKAEATVILGRLDPPAVRRKDLLRRRIDRPAMALDSAGIPWMVGSGASTSAATRFLAFNAQMATASCQDHDPLPLITARAADFLGVAQIGRLRPGMLADFVLWSGDPMDPASKALRVFVGGQEVFADVE